MRKSSQECCSLQGLQGTAWNLNMQNNRWMPSGNAQKHRTVCSNLQTVGKI